MGFLGSLVQAAAFVLDTVLTLYFWVVIISALLSWVNPDPYNPIVRFLRGATEPVFYKIRRSLPFLIMGGFDLTPLVVLLGIQVLKIVVVQNLFKLAYSMSTGMPM